MSRLADFAAPAGHAVRDLAVALRLELSELRLLHGRGPQCAMTTLAVTLATTVAMELQVTAVWWAAISALVSIQATAAGSIQRGALRILGTTAGAALGLLASPWVIGDPVALILVLLVVSTWGVLGLIVSFHGYAWLLGAITTDMVLLAALADPLSALDVACNRTAEVAIGTLTAILVALLLAPDSEAEPPVAAPGWSGLLSVQWPALRHALRAGIGVTAVPLVGIWLALPNLSQSAITVAAVMAVPVLSDDAAADRRRIIDRAMHRVLGCLLGGTAGLACLALSVTSFLAWLPMLAVGIWIAAHVQGSHRGIGYVGTQGAVVFIATLVQGWGPPDSIGPGIDRFAGITGGVLILLIVALLTEPTRPAAEGK